MTTNDAATHSSWWKAHGGKPAMGSAAAVLAAFALTRWWSGPQVSVLAVVQRDFVQTVVASARVQTPHRVDLGAQITGTVRHVPVAEGQTVAAGTLFIELDNAELQASVTQADTAVQQAQARLRQLREVQAPVAERSRGLSSSMPPGLQEGVELLLDEAGQFGPDTGFGVRDKAGRPDAFALPRAFNGRLCSSPNDNSAATRSLRWMSLVGRERQFDA